MSKNYKLLSILRNIETDDGSWEDEDEDPEDDPDVQDINWF